MLTSDKLEAKGVCEDAKMVSANTRVFIIIP
jgi:hypothetical protein